jgi:hypothetical protein
MSMQISPFEVALGAGLVVSIALIVYIFKTNRELAQTVLEEKVTILKYAIPILDSIVPYLPPDKQPEAKECVEALQMMQKINEALLQVPATKLRKAWKTYRVQVGGG